MSPLIASNTCYIQFFETEQAEGNSRCEPIIAAQALAVHRNDAKTNKQACAIKQSQH